MYIKTLSNFQAKKIPFFSPASNKKKTADDVQIKQTDGGLAFGVIRCRYSDLPWEKRNRVRKWEMGKERKELKGELTEENDDHNKVHQPTGKV